MMKRFLKVVGLSLFGLIAALVAYLALWPVPIEPVAWNAPMPPGYVGVHAVNGKLANLQLVNIGEETGPEHMALGPDGKLYAAMASGNILRMNPDGTNQERFVNTGGRVLGFDFDANGNLIAADAMKGLLKIAPDKTISLLAAAVRLATKDDPIRYANSVVIAKSGKIYFSDASRRFAPTEWGGTFNASVLDILEQSSTGRILEYDPTTPAMRVVANGLSFANGVALSADEQHLLVAETGKYRVWKIAVTAHELDVSSLPQNDQRANVLLSNLPGYPDNLMRGLPSADGKQKYWLGFAKPRSTLVDRMGEFPFLRKLTVRLPKSLWPIPPRYGHVIAFTEAGEIIADLQDPSGAYPETTAVTETKERLYIQSLHAKSIGWLRNQ